MPHAFPRWLKAAETVSHEFKQDELPRRGVNRGYVLPEAAVFANHENEVSRQKYFLTYLKIHRVFIAAIDLLGPIACQRSAKDWRRLVSLELHGSLNSETHESAAKLELCREMNEVATRMGSSFVSGFTYLPSLSHFKCLSLLISQTCLKLLRFGEATRTLGPFPTTSKGRSSRRSSKFLSNKNFSC